MSTSWDIVAFRGNHGLRQLEADWDRLVAAVPARGFHLAYETHLAYFTHMPSPDGAFTCLALSDGESIRAICPLEPEKRKILGLQTLVWGLPLSQRDLHRDVICPAGEAQRELLPQLLHFLKSEPQRFGWLVFDRILDGSSVWQCVQSLDQNLYCTDVVGAVGVVACDRSFDDLTSRLSKNFRGNLRSGRRKLSNLADVRFVHATAGPDVRREFEVFLEVEATGWKGEAGTTLRQRPQHVALYRDLAASRAGTTTCEISALYAEGRCIASVLWLRTGAECALMKIAYDERYSRLGPGHLLLERTIQNFCADPEIKSVNLLGNAAWLNVWRPHYVPMHCVYLAVGRWSGPPLMLLLRLRFRHAPRIKRLLQRFGVW